MILRRSRFQPPGRGITSARRTSGRERREFRGRSPATVWPVTATFHFDRSAGGYLTGQAYGSAATSTARETPPAVRGEPGSRSYIVFSRTSAGCGPLSFPSCGCLLRCCLEGLFLGLMSQSRRAAAAETPTIVAACDADNAASILTLERVGFQRTGEARDVSSGSTPRSGRRSRDIRAHSPTSPSSRMSVESLTSPVDPSSYPPAIAERIVKPCDSITPRLQCRLQNRCRASG